MDLIKVDRSELLEQFIWDKVTWTFKIIPQSDGNKEGRIKAEWPGDGLQDGYTRIFNTRDITKMSQWEWITFNQQEMIKDIITKLEVKFKDQNGYYINGIWFPYGGSNAKS